MNKDRKMRSETIILRPEVPLLERLSTYAASDAYPFHMPGHKRQVKMGITSVPNPFSVDITEINGFDNLHHAEDILKESMNSAAAVYGADRSWYLVNGSTCGILAAIAAAVKPGEKILMARNSHKSAYHAVVLNQLERYIYIRRRCRSFRFREGIEPEQVERALFGASGDPGCVCDFPRPMRGSCRISRGFAATAHRHGAALIVDEAHGAHLPFGDGNYFPDGALQEEADLVIQSLHKTLPSLTQTAILHLKSQILDAKKVEQYLSVYQSSSPSYILIASMENCVRYMAEKGAGEMARYGARLRELREKLAKLKYFRLLKEEICGAAGVYGYDPSKLVLFPDFMTGTRLAEVLRTEYHLEAEMSSGRYVLLMTSFMDTEEGFSRLERALLELDARVEKLEAESVGLKDAKQGRQEPFSEEQLNRKPNQENDSENYPQQMCLPWQAWHGDGMLVPLEEAEGRVARTCVTIYPPGVPMLMPGERIGTREIARIREDWKLGLTVEGICEKSDKLNLWIEVVI